MLALFFSNLLIPLILFFVSYFKLKFSPMWHFIYLCSQTTQDRIGSKIRIFWMIYGAFFPMQINQWNGRIHVNLLHRKWSYSTGLISFGSINGKKKIRVDLTFTPIFITIQAITKALSFPHLSIYYYFFLYTFFHCIFFFSLFLSVELQFIWIFFHHSCSFSVRPCFRHACNHNLLCLDWHTPRSFIAW